MHRLRQPRGEAAQQKPMLREQRLLAMLLSLLKRTRLVGQHHAPQCSNDLSLYEPVMII